MRLGLIGGGAMGEAIIAAVVRAAVAAPADICLFEPVSSRAEALNKSYGVSLAAEAKQAAMGADLLIFAVKPQDFAKAAASFAGGLATGTAALSIMAGVTVAQISAALGTEAVIRAMPNTPAQIGAGMTVWTATSDAVGETALQQARSVLAAMGKEAFVAEERYLDMATAISGSGPAYVFLFLEALIDAGVQIGLSRDLASTMALQTVLGSALYADKTGKHVAELRNQVTSPGGTTAEALRAFEEHGLRHAVQEAVRAAYSKSRALGEGKA